MDMIHLPSDFSAFLRLLNEHDVKYLLVGGYAVGYYGYVRATADPKGLAWTERVTLVEPGALHKDTCSYASLLRLSKTTALVAYSDFNRPGPKGAPRKTILARKVKVSDAPSAGAPAREGETR